MNEIKLDKVKKLASDSYMDIVNAKIAIANDVSNRTFLFDMPNDLERTTKPVHFDGDINWEYAFNGDKEFAYQLARHRFCIDMAEAYHMTGNEEYVKTIVDILRDFITRCPYSEHSLAWRTLETGLRGEYWTRTMALIKDSKYVTPEFLEMYKTSLDVHANLLIDKKIPHHRLSNWGVLQDHGLFAIGVELNNANYMEIALERLYEEAALQLMADGVHWEVSATYHNEVLGCFVDTIIRANAIGYELDKTFLKRVKSMVDVHAKWVKPNHTAPLYGDSDVTDLRGMMATCALLFNDGTLKYLAGNTFDYDHAWQMGDDAIDAYAGIKAEKPANTSVSLSDSGNYIMRSSYDEDSNYLIFHNSKTGGGHAHEDKLSFELSVSGHDLLVDTGRYSYVWNKERKMLKSYRSHNTTAVDNSNFVKAFGWDYIGNIAESIKEDMIITPIYEFAQGTHLGYMNRLLGGIKTSRYILWIKPDIYVIIDEFNGKGRHMYSSFWNFAPHTSLNINGNIISCKVDNVSANMTLFPSNIDVSRETGLYSHHYNAIENIDRVVASIKGKANAHMATVIIANDGKHSDVKVEELPVKDAYGNVMRDAIGIKICMDGKTYTIAETFKEHIKLLFVDGKPVTQKVTLYVNNDYYVVKS